MGGTAPATDLTVIKLVNYYRTYGSSGPSDFFEIARMQSHPIRQPKT